jgi:hypothetical protein
MKMVVIGGSGLIGPKVVTKPGEHGHEAVAASPNTGVNTLTGEAILGETRYAEPRGCVLYPGTTQHRPNP